MTKRAVLYARVSGDDTKKDGLNLKGQLDMCREYAAGQGWQVVAELAEDERGVSGARWDAPELNRALELAQGGAFDVLLVREMDRFARKLAKQLVVEEQFKRAGVGVVYVLEEYADSPEGRLSKHIRATIAEYEREKIRERMERGRRRTVKNGSVMVHGAGAPYGYRLHVENKDGHENKDGRLTLVIYEDEAVIVRLIFEWYTREGLTIRAIARRLTEMRVPTPADKAGKKAGKPVPKKRGACQWGPSSVANILEREAYAGTWWYGRYNNFTNTTNPKDHQIAVTVPAIIDRETWQLAQARKKQNKAMAARNTRHDYLLRAMITCGQCGASVGAQAVPYRQSHYLYYRCNAAKKSESYVHQCDMPQFRADIVDAVVWDWLRDILSNPERIREKAEKYQELQAQAVRPLMDKLTVIDGLLKKEREQLDLLLDLYLDGGLLRDMLIDRQKRIETRITALENDRAELVQQIEAETLTEEQIYSLEQIAVMVGEGVGLADADFSERRFVAETLNLKGEILLMDGQQYVKASVYLGDEATLNVSRTLNNPAQHSAFCRRHLLPSSPLLSFAGRRA